MWNKVEEGHKRNNDSRASHVVDGSFEGIQTGSSLKFLAKDLEVIQEEA